jgi:hypothetical protein
MSSIPLVEDTRLEELIDKAVQKHLKLTIEDMEVVRRSPAASIIRLEQKVELMVTKDEFREKIGKIEVDVAGVKSTQKLLISLCLSILGIVGAIFVKMFFFQ